MVVLARRLPRLAVELSVSALAYLLSASAYHMWWGGNSAPARFAVPVLPLLVLPGARLWVTPQRSVTRMVAMTLLLTSIAMTAMTVIVNGGQLAYNVRDGYSRLAEWMNPLVDLSQALPSFFRQSPGAAVLRSLVWLANLGIAWALLRYTTPSRWRRLAAPVLLATAITLSATIVWKLQNVAGTRPETGSLRLLEHASDDRRATGLDLSHAVVLPKNVLISRIAVSTPESGRAAPSGTLLVVPGIVPAGSYAFVVADPSHAAGTASLVVGRNATPVAEWDLRSELHDGAIQFDLPVSIGSLIVRGSDEAMRSGVVMSLHPIELAPASQRLTGDYARRIAPYGPARAYFFDDAVFVEEPGFWVRGGMTARVALMSVERAAPLVLFLRNAAVRNRVRVQIDGTLQTLDLEPREERPLPLKAEDGRRASMVTITSETGFRPSEVDGGSTDTRFLGVWVEPRPK
jgi:hypothetical protein